jgi:hypothetical protein
LEQDDGTIQERLKLLEGIGLRVFSLSHFVLQKVKQLPFPLGSTIKVVEDIIGPPMQPLVTCVKNQTLYLLSCIDDQVFLTLYSYFCFYSPKLYFLSVWEGQGFQLIT